MLTERYYPAALFSLYSFLCTDSVDTARHCVDLGVQTGKQRRTRDIISWVKKRRRHIRREDLLAFLCGKNPPPRSRIPSGMVLHSQSSRIERPFPRFPSADSIPTNTEPDLQAFREAIALQGKEDLLKKGGLVDNFWIIFSISQ